MKELLRREISERMAAFVIVAALLAVGLAYSFMRIDQDIKEIRSAEALSREMNAAEIASLQAKLEELRSSNNNLVAIIKREENARGSVAEKVGEITSTLGNLEKLSKMDPELLKKYSKIYFLNEHYVPLSLATIAEKFESTAGKHIQIHASVAAFLNSLLLAAESNGLSLRVVSGFRSFGTQATLKSSYKVTYGTGTANSFSADQGYSEHQLGTTVDFTSVAIGGALTGFEKTSEYAWLLAHAYEYGFIISYPKENTYYQYEPWHWRFVGKTLAKLVHDRATYFYSLDQREIDTYLGSMFDQ